MHHTHAPSENENFPSAKPPARTSFLSFFPSHFRSSFRHFCHVLCDFYFSFQVPKPPVFAAFSLLQGILLLILFFLFLRQKTSSQGNPLKQGFWWFYGIFNFFFSIFLFVLLMLCFHIFPLHRYLSGAGNHQKKSHKKWQKNLHLNIESTLFLYYTVPYFSFQYENHILR